MGIQIAKRLHKNGFKVFGWNRSAGPVDELKKFGGWGSSDLTETVGQFTGQRIFWVMLPHEITHEFIFGEGGIASFLKPGDIVIDGGNTFFKESMENAKKLNEKGIIFYDCGTSGGIWGFDNGFALMVGGPKEKWPTVEPIIKALSAGENYGLVGPNGAGHFVKMVHNGIEYGMMEAIGEGYGILEASELKPDLKQVTKIYQQGTVVRSWLIDLVADIYDKEDIAGTKGEIGSNGEGEWTVKIGKELGVEVRVLEDSVNVRKESMDPKNQQQYSNKIVALLRKQFGGHAIAKK